MDPADRAALARARSYPYRAGSAAAEAFELGGGWGGGGPVLVAFGANAAPGVLAGKLGPGARVSAVPATLLGFDVAYSAHVSPYGAVPGALVASPGAGVAVHVLRLDPGLLQALDASEPNYVRVDIGGLQAYLTRHGALALDGGPVALAGVGVRGRTLPALDEAAVLERVRALIDPTADPDDFVLAQARDARVRAARTAALPRTPALQGALILGAPGPQRRTGRHGQAL
jgi:hypothetical protein